MTDFNPFAIEGKARLDWALFYAAQGWPVFPCSWSGGRAPLVKWRAEASTDPEQIRQWWTRWPPAFIGAPAGIGFVVLDVDVRADRDGFWHGRTGNANPLLYLLYNLGHRGYFHDITATGQSSNNGFFPTTPGYDLATGIGTPKMDAIITGVPRE